MDEWELFLRKLTLERHTGMPRWNLTAAPERTPTWATDTAEQVAQRRRELEELAVEEAMRANRRRLRRVA